MNVDDLMDKALGQRGALEKLLAGLPGIKGYKDKELRRASDKAVRDMIAKQLQDQYSRLSNVESTLVDAGQYGVLDDAARAGVRLQLLIDRVRTASYGYAPLFDAIKVEENELAALAQFDQDMVQGVDRVRSAVDALAAPGDRGESAWLEAIHTLADTVSDLNTQFGHRDDVILHAAPSSAASTDLLPAS